MSVSIRSATFTCGHFLSTIQRVGFLQSPWRLRVCKRDFVCLHLQLLLGPELRVSWLQLTPYQLILVAELKLQSSTAQLLLPWRLCHQPSLHLLPSPRALWCHQLDLLHLWKDSCAQRTADFWPQEWPALLQPWPQIHSLRRIHTYPFLMGNPVHTKNGGRESISITWRWRFRNVLQSLFWIWSAHCRAMHGSW